MTILTTRGWEDYELLDSGDGYRLERFGTYTVARPDPQAIWQKKLSRSVWEKADAVFQKNNGKEGWEFTSSVPERWRVTYKDIALYAKLTPFKHTGVFPEQHLHWDVIRDLITESSRSVNVLNLFAYTGGASLIAAAAGAQVTHVDASRPAISWARDNQILSGLSERPVRWILDDAIKFVHREIRRGNTYDGIVMDPPVYGHGPNGEKWDFPESFPHLLSLCRQVLSARPLFIIVNAYAISMSALMLENVMNDFLNDLQGELTVGELALQENIEKGRLLSTGIFARWLGK